MSNPILDTLCSELKSYGCSCVTSETRLQDLPIDSLTNVVLLVLIEDRYDVTITLADEKMLDTVGDLVTAIESKLPPQSKAA